MTARKLIVTGVSSGIGRAISLQRLARGDRIIGIARNPERIGETEGGFFGVAMDLTDLERLPTAIEAVLAEHPDVTGVISNVGRGQFGSLEEFSYQQIRSLMELNFLSHALLVRAVLPRLKRAGQGDIIFIGSESALRGGSHGAVYSATKFALRGFAQALRQECAGRGIRVGIINPGMVRTAFFDALGFQPGEESSHFLLAEDVAEAVGLMLELRVESVIDEINLTPLKRVVRARKES